MTVGEANINKLIGLAEQIKHNPEKAEGGTVLLELNDVNTEEGAFDVK